MPRKTYKYHYIYKTTNVINEKFYVGMHSTDNLDDDYIGSGTVLARSIRKYGKENFVKEILEFFPDRESLRNREGEIVNEHFVNDKMCMNVKLGGEKGNFGTTMPNRKSSPLSESHRFNISKSLKGKIGNKLSNEARKKLKELNKGKKASSETKLKMSESHKKIWESGIRKRKEIINKPVYYRQIYQYDLDDNLLKTWNSTKEIFLELGYQRTYISKIARKSGIYENYKWTYYVIKKLKMEAVIKTNKGEMKVFFYDHDAPNTVKNFTDLASKGFYNGLKWHRVIPNFVIQGGCPIGNGAGGPGYSIPCELTGENQYHERGVLSMAHAGRNTGGSQFFICHSRQNTSHLDRNHTCFGKVYEGLDVLDNIQQGDTIESIEII